MQTSIFFITIGFIVQSCTLCSEDTNNPMYCKVHTLMDNVKLYEYGNAMQYSDIHYTISYLSLVTNHTSLIEHHDITLYVATKDYETDMQAWKKWLQKNKNRYTLTQIDSMYQIRTDSVAMRAWNRWLKNNSDKYNQKQKDSINLLYFGGVVLSERPQKKRMYQKYDILYSDTIFIDFNQKMNKLIQDVKKFYLGKPVEFADVYYSVNYLGLITEYPTRLYLGEIAFYQTCVDYQIDISTWKNWLKVNKNKYTLQKADSIFQTKWNNLDCHPCHWLYEQ